MSADGSRDAQHGDALIAAVWAQTPDGVIGRDGSMPWRLPEDLAHFAQLTRGHPVIMGRATWESFPARFRPLPGRTNIVLTSSPDAVRAAGQTLPAADDGTAVRTAASWPEAVAAARRAPGGDLTWVIGGGRVYREAMADRAHPVRRAVVTVVDVDEPGDTWAPDLSPPWRLEHRGAEQTSRTGLGWHVEHWAR